MPSARSKPYQDAQTTVDALRLAVESRHIAPEEGVWWVIDQILAMAPPSDGGSTLGYEAFHEAVKDYNTLTEASRAAS